MEMPAQELDPWPGLDLRGLRQLGQPGKEAGTHHLGQVKRWPANNREGADDGLELLDGHPGCLDVTYLTTKDSTIFFLM